jgi:adenosylhomocysteine nucleosidase
MNDLAIEDPCLLFALRREAGPFLREFRPTQRFSGAPCSARFCGPAWLSVLVVETGIGPQAAHAALEWLLRPAVFGNLPCRPKVVLAAGFAGALQEGYRVGDIILATEVVDQAGTCRRTTWPGELPEGTWRPPLLRGRLLSIPTLLGTPEEKRRLGQQHAAIAVDMESAVIAQLCQQHGIPFGCVRTISDDVDTPLSPRLVGLLAQGRVSPWRLTAALLRSPRLVGELWRLRNHTQSAAEQLGRALGELLTLTLPWSP